MTIERAFVEYPLGLGQKVDLPHQVFPPSFSQFVNLTDPVRLTLAGLGYLDLPSGIDVWTPEGYVPVEEMLSKYLEFAPQFSTWQLANNVYVSQVQKYAAIRRSKVLAVTPLTGTQLKSLPLYEGTFIQLEPVSQTHVAVTLATVPETNPRVPLSLTCIAEIPVTTTATPTETVATFEEWVAQASASITDREILIAEFVFAMQAGSSSYLYDGDGDPIQVSGIYNSETYLVTYVYGTFASQKRLSYAVALFRGVTLTNIYAYDGSANLLSTTGWT